MEAHSRQQEAYRRKLSALEDLKGASGLEMKGERESVGLGLEKQAGQLMRRLRSLVSSSRSLQNWVELTFAWILKLVSPNSSSLALSHAPPPLIHGTVMSPSTLFSKGG